MQRKTTNQTTHHTFSIVSTSLQYLHISNVLYIIDLEATEIYLKIFQKCTNPRVVTSMGAMHTDPKGEGPLCPHILHNMERCQF